MATQPLWGSVYDLGDVTPDDLATIGGEGVVSELWEGQLVQETMTYPHHAIIANRIGFVLMSYLIAAKSQQDVAQHMLFNLTQIGQPRTVLAPDVAILPVGFVPTPRRVPHIAPWLAVEILSPRQTLVQMRLKSRAYLIAGAAEVWLVDPEQHLIEVVTPSGTNVYQGGQIIGSAILPGFGQTVDDLVH